MWNTTGEADTYFSTLYGSTWSSLSSTDKTALLTTANRKLVADPLYSFPTVPTDGMKQAECELAYSIYDGTYKESDPSLIRFIEGGYSEQYDKSNRYFLKYPSQVLSLISQYRIRFNGTRVRA